MGKPVIISVGGGKGGVGKSTVTANIGTLLAKNGFTVGYIDADLGGANLHLCLGARLPSRGLQDYIRGTCRELRDVAVPVPESGGWLISGASDILELANPNFAQKQRIIRNLSAMEADFILVDLGAGSDTHVTDFYAAFPFGVIVTDGLPTSIENAYGFLKNGVLRGFSRIFSGDRQTQTRVKKFIDPSTGKNYATIGEMLELMSGENPGAVEKMRRWLQLRRTFLVLNMVKEADDVRVGVRFAEMVKKYLCMNVHYIGYIVDSPEVRQSIKALRPLVAFNRESKAAECFASITNNLLALTRG